MVNLWIKRISSNAIVALLLFLPLMADANAQSARLTEKELKHKSFDVSPLPQTVKLSDITHFQKVLSDNDFCLAKSMEEDQTIPRIYFANFPSDLRHEKNLNQKKEIFLHVLLPMVLCVNEEIIQEREELILIKKAFDNGEEPTETQKVFLQGLCEKYKMDKLNFNELLRRVDVIPPSLALGQAIIESGWGNSYAALKKNSPFGMTISQEVKAYKTLYDSVSSYVRNLNSNNAYGTMRKTREKFRNNGVEIDGYTLIGEMLSYSEERKKYIGKVRNAISAHGLTKYDSFSLIPTA